MSEVDSTGSIFPIHLFSIFWSCSWRLTNFSHSFQFRALLKAVGFEGIVVEKRETEKMENKTKVPLQTFHLPQNRTQYILCQNVLCYFHLKTLKVFERFRTRFLSWFHQLTDEVIKFRETFNDFLISCNGKQLTKRLCKDKILRGNT